MFRFINCVHVAVALTLNKWKCGSAETGNVVKGCLGCLSLEYVAASLSVADRIHSGTTKYSPHSITPHKLMFVYIKYHFQTKYLTKLIDKCQSCWKNK